MPNYRRSPICWRERPEHPKHIDDRNDLKQFLNPEWGGPMSAQAIGLGHPPTTKRNPKGVAIMSE